MERYEARPVRARAFFCSATEWSAMRRVPLGRARFLRRDRMERYEARPVRARAFSAARQNGALVLPS